MTTRDTSITRLATACAFALLLGGCGDSSPESTSTEAPPPADPAQSPTPAEPQQPPQTTAAPEQPPSAGESGGQAAGNGEVRIGSTDQMQFTVTEFTVPAGEEVTLTLVHEGQLPATAMGHNVVILKQGETANEFGTEVMQSGGSMENDYVPESMRDRVIAFTEIIGGGESTTITFTAPEEPGEYPFLCSFPGHFAMMNGTMIVR